MQEELRRVIEALQRPYTSTTAESPYALQPMTPATALPMPTAEIYLSPSNLLGGGTEGGGSSGGGSDGDGDGSLVRLGEREMGRERNREVAAADPFGVDFLVNESEPPTHHGMMSCLPLLPMSQPMAQSMLQPMMPMAPLQPASPRTAERVLASACF